MALNPFFGRNTRKEANIPPNPIPPDPTKTPTAEAGETLRNWPKHLEYLIKNPPEHPVKMAITPARAVHLLSKKHPNIRPLKEVKVRELSRELVQGKWIPNPIPIIFSDTGYLLNGQHRLNAVIRTGISVEEELRFGQDEALMKIIDTNLHRTAADDFHYEQIPQAARMAAAAFWVHRYLNNGMTGVTETYQRPSKSELLETYFAHPNLLKSATAGTRFTKGRLAAPTLMTALHYICHEIDPVRADDFFLKLATGENLSSRSSVMHLRNLMLERRAGMRNFTDAELAAWVIQAWNSLRKGYKTAKFERRARNEEFPRAI